VLGEGAAMRAFDGRQLLVRERVTPYDAVAVWMHLVRAGRSDHAVAEGNPSRADTDKLPKDNHIRSMLDQVPPELL
jgi:hypothetical protein